MPVKARRRALLLATGLAASLFSIKVASATVTVLGWPGGPEEVALKAASDAYNRKPGVAAADKVQLLFFNREGFWDKLLADLAAGTTAFDANLLATYSIGRYAPFMEPVELDSSAAAVVGEPVLKTMQFDSRQYGVPTDLSMHFLYFRKDLIDELLGSEKAKATYTRIAKERLGLDLQPKPPADWTWDDFAAMALYFTKAVNRESPTRYGTVLQMKNLLFNMMVFQSVPRSYGGNWTSETGEVTIDSTAYRKGLELYKLLYDVGATPKDSLSYEFAEANAAFASGQVAAMVQWNAAAAILQDPNQSPTVAETTRILPPPSGRDGRFTHIHSLGLGLSKTAANKEGAKRFLRWMSTEEAALAYARAGGAPALTPEVAAEINQERPDLAQLGEFAVKYGFVMNGATSANALPIYELQAREFTGYWSGQTPLDAALSATKAGMINLLKK